MSTKPGQSQRVPGVLSVTFDELRTEAGCARVYEHCLGLPHDRDHWRALAWKNLTVNFPAKVRYFDANAPQIERLKQTATHRILDEMARRCRVAPGSITFQQEPFPVFLQDAQGLVAKHHVRVGAPPDEVERMNLPLMQTMHDLGLLHVTTARAGGRMVGYLMTVSAPSLETRNRTETHALSFFADPSAPGIGIKLQRASLAAARERGADVLYFRAGVRASGPRLGALYRRLGAVPAGELYSLELGS